MSWVHDWRPDEPVFWEETGKRVARRNLIFSILAEHLGFTIWTMWSVVAVKLGAYKFSMDQLFWLVALPNLVGSVIRIPYTFAPARFGGRNWTVVSALLLLIPAALLTVAASNPETPYWMFLLIAATAGVGGGNFASSMANITYFYPEGRQGIALGLNAAGGNIGVSSVQLLLPLIIGGFGLAAAGLFWVPFILVAAACAYFLMDNLTTAKANLRDQMRAARRAQTWIVAVLYIGTFGSFIGYATAFPLLAQSQFAGSDLLGYAFAGALVGSVVRPLGGMLADRLGGARVTLVNFVVMGVGVLGVYHGISEHSAGLFLGAFLSLFVAAGIGNGSTYRMIPSIFRAKALEGADSGDPASLANALAAGRRDSAAAIGIISAIGALGGFLINRAFGASIAATGGAGAALAAFAIFYGGCLLITWWCYLRTVGVRLAPNLAAARV